MSLYFEHPPEHQVPPSRTGLPRRQVLLSAVAAAGLALVPTGPAFAKRSTAGMPATAAKPVAFTLPSPTGRHRIGTVALHLVDAARTDPWVARDRKRELMVQLWYPTEQPDDYPLAPWLTPAEAKPVGLDFGETLTGTRRAVPGLADLRTHGHLGAPVAERPGGWPVVLFSPGFGAERNSSAGIVEDLVSRGYLVVTIDHTHDAMAVEFPDGRVEPNTIVPILQGITDPKQVTRIANKMVGVRTADARYVLDQLAVLNTGGNPTAESQRLPSGLTGAFRRAPVGMFGHSLGGATAAQVMCDDSRVAAGINVDGTPYGSVVTNGLDRPFLLIAAGGTSRATTPAWGTFSDHLRGWHHEIRLGTARHLSFHDTFWMVPELAKALSLTLAQITEAYGTIDRRRALIAHRAYVAAFFDLHLRHRDRHLFDGPSAQYPEVTFVS